VLYRLIKKLVSESKTLAKRSGLSKIFSNCRVTAKFALKNLENIFVVAFDEFSRVQWLLFGAHWPIARLSLSLLLTARIVCGRVYVTVRCPSVFPSYRPLQQCVVDLLLCTRPVGDISQLLHVVAIAAQCFDSVGRQEGHPACKN